MFVRSPLLVRTHETSIANSLLLVLRSDESQVVRLTHRKKRSSAEENMDNNKSTAASSSARAKSTAAAAATVVAESPSIVVAVGDSNPFVEQRGLRDAIVISNDVWFFFATSSCDILCNRMFANTFIVGYDEKVILLLYV